MLLTRRIGLLVMHPMLVSNASHVYYAYNAWWYAVLNALRIVTCRGPIHKRYFKFYPTIIVTFLQVVFFQCIFFLKYIVTLFLKKIRIHFFLCLLRESGPWSVGLRTKSNINYMVLFRGCVRLGSSNYAMQHGGARDDESHLDSFTHWRNQQHGEMVSF